MPSYLCYLLKNTSSSIHGSFLKKGGPQCKPHNIIIRIIGTSRMVPPISGNPHIERPLLPKPQAKHNWLAIAAVVLDFPAFLKVFS